MTSYFEVQVVNNQCPNSKIQPLKANLNKKKIFLFKMKILLLIQIDKGTSDFSF